MLRIIQKAPDSAETVTYQFHFNSPSKSREEANSIKNVLTSAISSIKSKDASIPRPTASSLPLKTANITAGVTGSRSNPASWFDDAQLKANIELQQSLMKNDLVLNHTYMEARRTKPETISDSQFNSQFWSTRTNLLRAHAIETNQKRAAYNVLSSVKPRQVDGELKMNISAEQVHLIFDQYPLVKHVHDENVPKLSEIEFWSRFFLSRLFKKLKGERIVESDSNDPIFDRYLDADNVIRRNNKSSVSQVPHIIDLQGNEENQGGNKTGNRKDFTMQPGSAAKVPIIHKINSLSENIMSHVAPSDINPADPIGMDERTYNSLVLRDLQEKTIERKLVLNVKEQSRIFSGESKELLEEDVFHTLKKPSEVLLALQKDIKLATINSDSVGGLDLSLANRVLEDYDSEDEDERKLHITNKACLQDAQKQIFEGIINRRHEINDSGTQSALSGLSQKIFDKLTLTHATTVEFLQHFWALFLSGDSERASELAKLVETLERAIDRIDAVANDAEHERQELISKQKQQIKDIFKSSGRKIQWSPNSVPGGAKAVKTMTVPIIKSLEKAINEYKRALKNEAT